MTKGYAAGVFDLFHIGHLNILRKAKSECDYLIVGATADELCERIKGKRPFIPLAERLEILEAIRFVDQVVVQDDMDKVAAWKKWQFDILFAGSDKHGAYPDNELLSLGCRIIYFPYTKTTSSSQIQRLINSRLV